MYFQSNPIATALKDLENRNERALYANWKPLQIINNRMALLFRHNASESEHTLLYVHHFIFHPLHRLTESEQYHLLYSSIEDVPTIAEKLRYARHMKGLRQKDIAEYLNIHLGQFTRDYTQTVKRAADNKRRYAPGEGCIPPVLLSGVSKGVPPLAHDFACKV